MPLKSIPVSLRISQEDAAFLASLKIGDAITPSEKIRELIKAARMEGQQDRNYASCEEMASKMIRPVAAAIHAAEKNEAIHSELVSLQIEWLIEMLAYVSSYAIEDLKAKEIEAFERAVAERCFRLFTSVARLGITKKAPCYDPEIIRTKLIDVFEILYIVELTKENKGGIK